MARWKKAISQIGYPRSLPLKDVFSLASKAGFEGVELRLSENGELTPRTSRDEAKAIRSIVDDLGIEVCSVAGGLQWRYPLNTADREVREAGVRAAIKAVEVAHWLDAPTILLVPAVVGKEPSYDESWRLSVESIARVAAVAKELGVSVGVENVWNRFIFTPAEMVRFIDEVNSRAGGEVAKAYLDVGNVVAHGFPEHWISALRGRIAAVHVKDLRMDCGRHPCFTYPFMGDVDWAAVVGALADIEYEGFLTAELPVPEASLESTTRYISMLLDDIMRLA